MRNIAGAFGISVFATILNNATEDTLVAISRYSVINSTSPLIRAQAAALMILKAQVDGYRVVFVVAAALMIGAAILAMFMLNVKELNSEVEIMVE